MATIPYMGLQLDIENEIAGKENADRSTNARWDAEVERVGTTECKQINSDIDKTNDTRGVSVIQVTEQRSQRCCSSNESALREVRRRASPRTESEQARVLSTN